MHVRHLSLVDFRSYSTAEVELTSGVTALVGANGRGKTNLVEALGYAATLASHRVATDAPLVRSGAPRAVVRVAVDRGGRSSLVEIEITPGRANRARLNRSPVPRVRDVLGVLRTVLFAPEDLALVKGDPDGRRRFMDDVLVALAPRLAGVQADYERVVRQRSTLLRSAAGVRGATAARGRRPPSRRVAPSGETAEPSAAHESVLGTLDVWDEQLATTGAELLAARLLLLQRIGPHVGSAYAAVSGTSDDHGAKGAEGQLVLGYRGSLPLLADVELFPGSPLPPRAVLAQALREQALASRAAELERGTSLVGPHRDDLALTLDGLPARGYASHGESWSAALALRLGTWALLRGDPAPADPELEPVLVLDDVFAELDAGRRERLAALVAGAEQVIVTAAVPQDVPPLLSGRRLLVSGGADGTVVDDGG